MATSFQNQMKYNVDVWWEKINSVRNVLSIPSLKTIQNTLAIPFRSRMKYNFDIIAPERKVANIAPIEDSFVAESNPYMVFGYGNNVLVGYDNNKKYEGLLKFDIQDYFPSFNKENIIILEAKLKLTIENVRDIENNIINIYEGFSEWHENSVTWNNKPIKSNDIVMTYEINKDEVNIINPVVYIDIKDTVFKWLDNPRKNNGIVLEVNENKNNIISFYSKESGNNEIVPRLMVTYIDLNSPFVIKNDYLHSFIYIWENGINNIISELEVVTRHSTKAIPSEMLVLNKAGDLLASLEITKDRFVCELNLVGHHTPCELEVYQKGTQAIQNSLCVQGINVENELKISQSSQLFNTLKTQYGKYLKGFLGINADRLVNKIDVHSWNNILNFLSIHEYWKIQNKLSTSYGDMIGSEILIPPMAHIKNKLEILVQGNMENDIFYGRFADLIGYLSIAPQDNIISNLLFGYENSVKSIANVFAVRQVINNIRYSSVKNLTNYMSASNINYIENILYITSSYLQSKLSIQELHYMKNSLGIQARALHGNLHTSIQKSMKSIINILDKTELMNYIKIINEHIENSINVYVKETNYCRGKIHALAVNNIIANLETQYGSNVEAKLDIYVDMMSVLNSYIHIINEDEQYNQRKSYGYIM